jgi:hypothetical protein
VDSVNSVDGEMKRCSKCKVEKPYTCFNKNASRPDGLYSWCRDCVSEFNKTKHAAYPEISREKNLRRKFGITISDYDLQLSAQNDVCLFCQKSCPSGRRLAVDHHHETGVVRGLLCANCNRAFGLVHEDPATIARMLDYAEAWDHLRQKGE